jgi:hypothetical protein
MAKPSKSVNGSVNNGAYQMSPSFVIDLKQSCRFNYLRWWHRTTDTGNGLRVWAFQILGTNDYKGPINKYTNPDVNSAAEDPTSWTSLGAIITFPTPISVESANIMIPLSNYRYVKVEYKVWDTVNNSAAQLSEFYLGLRSSEYSAK